ncbi:MAG: hypothetical protein IT269_08175 [Saprospiraceae bacterium]|nr:hypothetical protein [Saprospiraceae bacterium]
MFNLILALHILGGGISLIAGTLVLILKKGTPQHRFWGRIFYLGMVGSAVASLALAVLHPNAMLFCVGVFSLYLVLSGKRALYFWNQTDTRQPSAYDYLLTGSMILFGLVSIGKGVYGIFNDQQMGIVLAVFGGIGLRLSLADIRLFKRTQTAPSTWLAAHISKMIGGYIAATTAFLVVNNTVLPALVSWLLPTVIGTVLIAKWRRKVSAQRP